MPNNKSRKSRQDLVAGTEPLDERLRKDLKDQEFREAFEGFYLEALIAEKVQDLREKRHLTQKQLAARAGMKQHAVSRIEKGEISLTLRTVQRVAKALGCAVEVDFRPLRGKRLAVA